jgi:hypothetical protein
MLSMISLLFAFYAIFGEKNILHKLKFLTVSFITLSYSLSIFITPLLIVWLLIRKKKFIVDRENISIVLLFLYAILLSFFSILDRFGLPLIVWIMTFGGSWILYLLIKSLNISKHDWIQLLSFLKKIVIIEIISGLLQFVLSLLSLDYRTNSIWRDSLRGSFGDANVFGFFIFLIAIYYFMKFLNFKNIFVSGILFIFLMLLTLLADAKLMNLSMIFSFLLLYPIFIIIKKDYLSVKFINIFLLSCVFLLSLNTLISNEYLIDRFDNVRNFYVENSFSEKVKFYDISFNEFKNKDLIYWITGVGPGEFGSKANEILSSDILYNPTFLHLPFHSSWTKIYLNEFNSEFFRDEIHKNYSFILSTYYSSFLAIKNELGLIGLLIFLTMIFSIVKNLFISMKSFNREDHLILLTLAIALISLVFFSFFDVVFEERRLMFPLMLYVGIIKAKVRFYEKNTIN